MFNATKQMREMQKLVSDEIHDCITLWTKTKDGWSRFLEGEKHSTEEYDAYMTHMSELMNQVRKLNIQLQVNTLEKAVVAPQTGVVMDKPGNILPSGGSDSKTPSGSSDSKTPSGSSESKTPPGSSDSKTPSGGSDLKTPPSKPKPASQRTLMEPNVGNLRANREKSEENFKAVAKKMDAVSKSLTFYLSNVSPKELSAQFSYQKPDLGIYQPGDVAHFACGFIIDMRRLLFYVADAENANGRKISQLSRKRHLNLFRPKPGEMFGLLRNGCVYRAVAANIPADRYRWQSGKELVLLIDTGEILEVTENTKCYRLHPALEPLPGLAILAELYDVKDVGSYAMRTKLLAMKHERMECRIHAVVGDLLRLQIVEKVPHRPQLKTGAVGKRMKGEFINITVLQVLTLSSLYAVVHSAEISKEEFVWGPREIPDSQLLDKMPQLRQIVLAKYDDDHWYRARVQEITPDGMLRIFYVDYGNKQIVTVHKLAFCPERLAQRPFQAVLCRLSNLRGLTAVFEKRKLCVDFMNKVLREKTLDVKVVQSKQDGFWISFVDGIDTYIISELRKMKALKTSEAAHP